MSSTNWFVYMILVSNNTLYTGITTDIERRWRQHCGEIKGGAKFFNGKKPMALVFLEGGHDRSSAGQREIVIKKLSRSRKEALTRSQGNRIKSVTDSLPVYSFIEK